MPARKRTPAAKSRSGRNIDEDERHTSRIVLRLPPQVADQLRRRARAEEQTLSGYVARLIATDLAIT